MHGLDFSIKAMLLAMATIALAIAGMTNASLWWGSICLSFLLAMLTLSLLGTVFRRGRLRAFWIGFAIVGWMYAALLYAPGLDRQIGHRLITTKLLAKLRPAIGPIDVTQNASQPAAEELALNLVFDDLFYIHSGNPVPLRAPQWNPFQQAGHMLCGIWLAGMAGIVAGRMSEHDALSSKN